MEEIWGVLGVHGCSTCLAKKEDMGVPNPNPPPQPRNWEASIAAVKSARLELMKGHGHKGKAEDMLKQQGLLDYHLQGWNPFFRLPHTDFGCFPMDRLHGVYVLLCLGLHCIRGAFAGSGCLEGKCCCL